MPASTKTAVKKAPVKKVAIKKSVAKKASPSATTKKPGFVKKKTNFAVSTRDMGGATNLVIVESPAKCATIGKYLGPDFLVMASYGHIVELEKKNMGIDIENGFTPTYLIDDSKKNVVSALKALAKKAKKVWIATDEDREGEAIGRHVANALGLDIATTSRITFHEITQTAIQHAIAHPRQIDMDLVNAQQARRILDRLVGFELSPVLWRKVASGLSAGRVQSVATRLVVDRERAIQAFVPKQSFGIQGDFITASKKAFVAKVDPEFAGQDQAQAFLTSCIGTNFSVSNIVAKAGTRSPSAPFTTSTLQQEASRRLGFSVSQTMRVAQKLYEAGHITYMRTDSVSLSGTAIAGATKAITANRGEDYIQVRKYTGKSANAQEAHECIRPTHFDRESAGGEAQERKLYTLIRQRAIASQMAAAKLDKTVVTLAGSGVPHLFTAEGEVITFAGFLMAYGDYDDEEKTDNKKLPLMTVGEVISAKTITALTQYERGLARFNEAMLVKTLESEGIGRPSTYAPTIDTIIRRGYVVNEDRAGTMRSYTTLTLDMKTRQIDTSTLSKEYGAERKKLFPTDMGILVTDFLTTNFENVVDYSFTARVEEEFDVVARGERDRRVMLRDFYDPFHALIVEAVGQAQRVTGERLLGDHPTSGLPVSVRMGRFGPFVQLGSSEDKKYASLRKGMFLENVTLEDALTCFDMPRDLGMYEDLKMTVSIGRFGPYVKRGSLFVSLGKGPSGHDPYHVTPEQCIELIQKKKLSDTDKKLRECVHKDTVIVVEKGRRGPFIRYGKENIKIPKDVAGKRETMDDTAFVAMVEKLRA